MLPASILWCYVVVGLALRTWETRFGMRESGLLPATHNPMSAPMAMTSLSEDRPAPPWGRQAYLVRRVLSMVALGASGLRRVGEGHRWRLAAWVVRFLRRANDERGSEPANDIDVVSGPGIGYPWVCWEGRGAPAQWREPHHRRLCPRRCAFGRTWSGTSSSPCYHGAKRLCNVRQYVSTVCCEEQTDRQTTSPARHTLLRNASTMRWSSKLHLFLRWVT